MYNYNKTITRFDNLNEFDIAQKDFMIPQHIYKLLNKLKKFDLKANVHHILRLSAANVNQDSDLKNIFDYFNWNEEKRIFEREIKQEELVKKIESAYDLKIDQIMQDEIADGEDNNRILTKKETSNNSSFTLHKANSNHPNGIYNNLNEDLSFSQNRNDGVESIFQVQKPIAITNSQGFERNLMNYEFNDVFLTNSAKVGWNQHSHLGEDESSLLSNWRRSNKNLPHTKTPSFHNTEDDIRANHTEELNSNINVNNFNSNLKNNIAFNNYGMSDRNYSEFLKTLKLSEGVQKFAVNNPNNGNFQKPSVTNLISDENLAGYSFDTTSNLFATHTALGEENNRNIKVSTFKIENKKKKKKELKKISSKKLAKQAKNKTPNKIKKFGDLSSKKIENSFRSSHFGLKEISKKVKEIVKKLKKTTYKEISDFIVSKINEKDGKDEKNIRRRIYDSLNVMKAMNLFEKDPSNKFIVWKGEKSNQIQNNHTNLTNFSFKKRKRSMLEEEELENENFSREELNYLIKHKKEDYSRKLNLAQQLWEQENIFKELLKRNEEQNGKILEEEKIRFPFIIIEFPENKHTNNINIIANDNKTQIHFSLDNPVSVYGDLDALKKINNKLSLHANPNTTIEKN